MNFVRKRKLLKFNKRLKGVNASSGSHPSPARLVRLIGPWSGATGQVKSIKKKMATLATDRRRVGGRRVFGAGFPLLIL
jgi:hypothetical protein